jgi:IS5 family transposase
MKAHLGVDSKTKLIHTILASAANVPDVDALPYLLHGRETRVWGDQGYQGRSAVIRDCAPSAKDFTNRRYRRNGLINETEKAKNRNKSRVRAKVEHTIGAWQRTCTGSKPPQRSRICISSDAGCSMRRIRVCETRRLGGSIRLSTSVPAETRVVVRLEPDSIECVAFMTSFSEFP